MIPLEQGSVFRQDMHKALTVEKPASQSLWNRAVSFDEEKSVCPRHITFVSIPLEQGSVFRHLHYHSIH